MSKTKPLLPEVNSRYQNHTEVAVHLRAPRSSMKMFLKFPG